MRHVTSKGDRLSTKEFFDLLAFATDRKPSTLRRSLELHASLYTIIRGRLVKLYTKEQLNRWTLKLTSQPKPTRGRPRKDKP